MTWHPYRLVFEPHHLQSTRDRVLPVQVPNEQELTRVDSPHHLKRRRQDLRSQPFNQIPSTSITDFSLSRYPTFNPIIKTRPTDVSGPLTNVTTNLVRVPFFLYFLSLPMYSHYIDS